MIFREEVYKIRKRSTKGILVLIMVLSMMFAATWIVNAAPGDVTPGEVTPGEVTPGDVTPGVAPVGVAPQDMIGKKVAFVVISGAVNVKPDAVLAVVRLKPGDVWTQDKVRQDLNLIYEMGTFSDVTADPTLIPEGVRVVYNVKENPVLKGFVFQGNKKVTREKLLSFMTVKPGEVINSQTVALNLRSIEEHYKAQSYVLAKTGDLSFSPEGILTVRINEGIVEDFVVKGNVKTKSFVITREFRLKKGEPFNSKDARRSMQKLYNLGYFEDVNMKLIPGRQPGQTVVEINVVEQKTGTFSIGGGFSEADGLIGIVTLGDKNFRGRGDNLKLHMEFGGKAATAGNYSIGFHRPWLDSKQTSLGFNIYNFTNEYIRFAPDTGVAETTFIRRYRGFDITLGRPSGEYLSHYITLKNRWDEFVQDVAGIPLTPEFKQANFGLTRSLILARVYDTRDSISNPSTGMRYSLSAEIARLGGDFNFDKVTAEVRRYWPMGKSQVLAVRGTLGAGRGFIPFMQEFTAGGIDSLRGYRDEQFRGNRLALGTVEYRFPLAKRVTGTIFTDIGNAWDGSGFQFIRDLHYGYGVGVRLITPLGPIRVDYAIGEQGGRLHFSFGTQF